MHVINNSWNTQDAPAHAGVTWENLIELAAQGGSTIIRVPTDLSVVTSGGVPSWVLSSYISILQSAQQNGVKVIFEPGQTPLDLLPSGEGVSSEPQSVGALNQLAQRFAMLVEAVESYNNGQYSNVIAGWEVGNEPNLSYQYMGDNAYYNGNGDPYAPEYAPRYWVVRVRTH